MRGQQWLYISQMEGNGVNDSVVELVEVIVEFGCIIYSFGECWWRLRWRLLEMLKTRGGAIVIDCVRNTVA